MQQILIKICVALTFSHYLCGMVIDEITLNPHSVDSFNGEHYKEIDDIIGLKQYDSESPRYSLIQLLLNATGNDTPQALSLGDNEYASVALDLVKHILFTENGKLDFYFFIHELHRNADLKKILYEAPAKNSTTSIRSIEKNELADTLYTIFKNVRTDTKDNPDFHDAIHQVRKNWEHIKQLINKENQKNPRVKSTKKTSLQDNSDSIFKYLTPMIKFSTIFLSGIGTLALYQWYRAR